MLKAMSIKPVAEWIGGIVTLPAYVMGEGDEPYRPEALVWMRTDGCVLGMMILKPGEKQTYLTAGVTPEAIASLFRSAARLFVAAPWKVVPDDRSTLSVTIDELGVRGAVLSIIGQLGESLGFILFPNREAFELFVDAGLAVQAGYEPAAMPPHFALNFDRGAELSPDRRKEIAAHGWEVAGPHAYPWLVAVDEDIVARSPTAREVVVAESIAAALVQLIETEPKLRHAWRRGKGLTRQLTVPTHAGPIHVTLSTSCDFRPSQERTGSAAAPAQKTASAGGNFDIRAEVRDGDGDLKDGWFESFTEELLERFAASSEGVLRADAAKELEHALSDPKNFGMAKSFFMAGKDAGFDTSSLAGAQEWASAYNAMNAAGSVPESLSHPARSADERRIKRNKRKAQRAGRKKNR